MSSRTYVGTGISGLHTSEDRLLIFSFSYVQVFRLNPANALPSFECGFYAEDPIDEGAVVGNNVILLNRQRGIEIHSIAAGEL